MAGRFDIIYQLNQKTYSVGLPVIVAGGNLLRDISSGRIFAQLKLASVSYKQISQIEVLIETFDPQGRPVEKIAFAYDGLSLYRDNTVGSDVTIPLEDNRGKSMMVTVVSVIDSSGQESRIDDPQVEVLRSQDPIGSFFSGDKQLAKQYMLAYGDDKKYTPASSLGLWQCSCGAINLDEEDSCHKCGFLRDTVFNPDMKRLASDMDVRVKKEKERNRNIIIIASAAAIVLIIALVVSSIIKPKDTYEEEPYDDQEEYYDDSGYDDSIDEESADEEVVDEETDDDPYYNEGNVYYVQTVLKVREGPGQGYRQLKRNELIGEDYNNSEDYPDALLKKGSPVTCLEMSGDWMRIESGWVCVWDGEALVE